MAPLPLDDAFKVAIQIADALSTAHRHGIVHRDLKPGNVMLTKAGAKLLDFGLAKASGPTIGGAGQSRLPTTPPNLTAQGTILGTFQYMAPEQLEGKEADARTDIFAFGAVLYEMLTGKRAFSGASHASLISSIMSSQPPPVSMVQMLAPAELDHLIARCLAKDPEDRWQSARDVVLELEWIRSTPFTNVCGSKPRSRWIIGGRWQDRVGRCVRRWHRRLDEPTVECCGPDGSLAVPLLDTASIVSILNGAPLAIAPDGSRVAFIGHAGSGRLLYVRRWPTSRALRFQEPSSQTTVFLPKGD